MSPEEASIGAVPVQDPKWFLSGKRVIVAELDQEAGGAGGADSVQVHQCGAGRLHEGGELLVGGLLALVDPLEVGDQLGRDPAAGLAGEVARADGGQEGFSLRGGQVLLRSAGDQLEQQVVDLQHLAGVLVAEGAAPVDQHPQHSELLVVDDGPQPGHPGADQSDGVRVGGVGLAPLSRGEHPGPGRELRRDVDDLLALAQQAQGDVPANTGAALDGPDPLRHAATYRSSAASPPRSVPNRPVPTTDSSPVMTSIVTDRLCGSIPITTRADGFPMQSSELEPDG